MTNELYKGNYIHGKRTKKPMYYENVVETIISKQKQEDCQYQNQINARHYERTATYLFTNKLKCAKCGRFLGGCATTKRMVINIIIISVNIVKLILVKQILKNN